MVAREGTLDNLSLVSGLGDIAQAVLSNDKPMQRLLYMAHQRIRFTASEVR